MDLGQESYARLVCGSVDWGVRWTWDVTGVLTRGLMDLTDGFVFLVLTRGARWIRDEDFSFGLLTGVLTGGTSDSG